ncbi:hypothetical protein MMC25_001190 [Agyrium rufum]|nr:hypothetical protein [Agyrium rufum]
METLQGVGAFPYYPLEPGEIRLMKVIDSTGRYICCEAQTVALEAAPAFTALSYTWEGQLNSRPLLCNGSKIGITSNLENYLREIQDGGDDLERGGWRWIDAVCINQTDIGEKGVQVPMMRDIYERAERIDVWLGAIKHPMQHTFDMIDRMKTSKNSPLTQRCDGEATQSSDNTKYMDYVRQGYELILSHPYWSRSWVLQEITTPKAEGNRTVRCGNRSCSWEDTIDLPNKMRSIIDDSTFQRLSKANQQYLKALSDFSSDRKLSQIHNRGPELDTYQILHLAKKLSAGDPRDNIYAPLLITRDAGIITADYTIPVDEAYMRLTVALMAKYKTLDIWGLCCPTLQDEKSKFPSWVTDWSSFDSTDMLPRERRGLGQNPNMPAYCADGGILRGSRISHRTKNRLRVRGFNLGDALFDFTPDRWSRTDEEQIIAKASDSRRPCRLAFAFKTFRGFGPDILVGPEEATSYISIVIGSQYPLMLYGEGPVYKVAGEVYMRDLMNGQAILIRIFQVLKIFLYFFALIEESSQPSIEPQFYRRFMGGKNASSQPHGSTAVEDSEKGRQQKRGFLNDTGLEFNPFQKKLDHINPRSIQQQKVSNVVDIIEMRLDQGIPYEEIKELLEILEPRLKRELGLCFEDFLVTITII